jgi:hypothetical protein
MKISHEVPLNILEVSRNFNHYDYCLPHLLDKYEKYKEYFLDAKKQGRYIIMDNSLHELGEAYDTNRLLYWIEILKPDEFIVPDVWENMEASINNAAEWANMKLPKDTLKVAVVQAKSIDEAKECYLKYRALGYRKIAFSYGAKYYSELVPHPTTAIATALGRVQVISTLYNNDVISKHDRVHLLGCAVPQEFIYYKDMPFIETIDTSNPIMAGIENTKYNVWGLDKKPTTRIDDVMEMSSEELNRKWSYIYNNIMDFKLINNIK